jgi:hypothetical protein
LHEFSSYRDFLLAFYINASCVCRVFLSQNALASKTRDRSNVLSAIWEAFVDGVRNEAATIGTTVRFEFQVCGAAPHYPVKLKCGLLMINLSLQFIEQMNHFLENVQSIAIMFSTS